MADIAWPVTSAPGARFGESAGRLINAFAEPLGEGARAPIVRKRVPGLTQAASSSFFGCRALHLVGTTLLAGFSGRVASVDLDAGTMTSLGSLAGSDRFTVAHNNAVTPNIVAVTEAGAFNLYTGSAPDAFADGDLPANPTSVCFQSGYFFFSYRDGRIFATGLNAVTVNALDFTTAQTRPGGVTRVIPYNGEILAFGPNCCDIYRNTANPTGFPYSHGDAIDIGLIGKFAIAGIEDGWINSLIFVSPDRVVYRLDGYTATPISTPDVVRSLQTVADGDDLEAHVYSNGPHSIWCISGPGFTWEYNVSTGFWNERKSSGSNRWMATRSVRVGNRWIVGAVDNGHLYAIDAAAYVEGTEPLIYEVQSAPGAIFPARIHHPRADFDFVVGVGLAAGADPMQTAPRVSLSWSDDGGGTWSTPLLRDLGGEGRRQQRVSLFRTGVAGPTGRQWKVVVSDEVYVGLIAGAMAAQPRQA